MFARYVMGEIMHYDENGEEGGLSSDRSEGTFVSCVEYELPSGRTLQFEVRESERGGFTAVCREYPGMVLSMQHLDDLQKVIEEIAPGYVRGMEERDDRGRGGRGGR